MISVIAPIRGAYTGGVGQPGERGGAAGETDGHALAGAWLPTKRRATVAAPVQESKIRPWSAGLVLVVEWVMGKGMAPPLVAR